MTQKSKWKIKQEQLVVGSKGKPQKEFLGIASDVSCKKRLYFLILLNHRLPSSPSQPSQKCNCRKWEVYTLFSSKLHWGEKSHTDKNLKDVLYLLQLHTKPHTQPANVAVLSFSRENNSDSFQWQTVGIKCGCGIFSKSQSHNKFRVKA